MNKHNPGLMRLRESPRDDGDYYLELPRAKADDPYDIEFMGDDDTLNPYKRGDAERTEELWNAAYELTNKEAVEALQEYKKRKGK